MMKPGDLDWTAIALAGDAGAGLPRLVPVPPLKPDASRWRPRLWHLLVLIAMLGWEAAGVHRAMEIGPPILEAIWSARP